MSKYFLAVCFALSLTLVGTSSAQDKPEVEAVEIETPPGEAQSPDKADNQPEEPEETEAHKALIAAIKGLQFRAIGPALMSGRVGDFAIDPRDSSTRYAAICSGGVWKTTDAGVTWKPIFDGQGSYSIGCVTIDPTNPNVVWVGSGENNSQRSVSFGDGVYRSTDNGASWKNMGLKESEHIGMIAVDPRDGDRVFVAAQGPLWKSGGERGLYRTTDGGQNWEQVLNISVDTGVNEVHFDPRDPDTIYASAYQRQRRVWTLIDGGPESGIWKSTDGGDTWRKINSGLPGGDKGRIGLAVAPGNPDVLYAIVEAAEGKGGVYRSTDRGERWTRRSGYMTSSPQYYNELVADPHDVDRLYALDTFLQVSIDGGKTWSRVPGKNRHVDDHALWIDPGDENHLMVGCDGGIYETWNRGGDWRFVSNLPVTQFYRVAVDYAEPFYNIYGGTQDNSTLGGPSRTFDRGGIMNQDWFVVVGGDGFEPQIDPTDPNIVYGQWQHGGLVRRDRRSGQIVSIRPRPAPGEEPTVFNWDSPLLISPHSHTRLYFAGRRLWKSENRGEDWTAVSGNLTRQLDRNALEIMGKIQKPEAVAKHSSTSIYGNIVALSESPLVEGLLYVGTDDGLVQVSEDGGGTWRRLEVEAIEGVPELTYVSCLRASETDADTVFLTLDNHKMGDFKPYVYRSDDRGRTWVSIAGDLPERHIAYAIAQDGENPSLLFCGTEFGAYCTIDGGETWVKLSGTPTIAVRDIEIQRRENDLVLGTFGRGFYVLDDYSMLRTISEDLFEQDAAVFEVRDPVLYLQRTQYGGAGGKGWQGSTLYSASNPPYGAALTYFIKEKIKTLKEQRNETIKDATKDEEAWDYPTIEQFKAEDRQREPRILLVLRDADGNIVRRIVGDRGNGVHRTYWNLRLTSMRPIKFASGNKSPWSSRPDGPLAAPGTYSVEVMREVDGQVETLAGSTEFELRPIGYGSLSAADRAALEAFQKKVAVLQGAVQSTLIVANEADTRLQHLRQAILETPNADPAWFEREQEMRGRLDDLLIALRGDPTLGKRFEPAPPSITNRVSSIVGRLWDSDLAPAQSDRDQYRYAGEGLTDVLGKLHTLIEWDIPSLEQDLEAAGAPWTPGRLPDWEFKP